MTSHHVKLYSHHGLIAASTQKYFFFNVVKLSFWKIYSIKKSKLNNVYKIQKPKQEDLM
jgi:hypothetical protein